MAIARIFKFPQHEQQQIRESDRLAPGHMFSYCNQVFLRCVGYDHPDEDFWGTVGQPATIRSLDELGYEGQAPPGPYFPVFSNHQKIIDVV